MAKVQVSEIRASEDLYVNATTAAEMLGVSVTTLYAYVSRKGIRSQAISGVRSRRYWRADIERILNSGSEKTNVSSGTTASTSQITLVTDSGRFYRGYNSIELSTSATLEDVAAILWEFDVSEISSNVLKRPTQFKSLYPLVENMPVTDRASVLFPFLEQADPRAYDLTPAGVCRTGMDVLRWYAAILLGTQQAVSTPIHEVVGTALKLAPEWRDLVRRLLVLGADTGVDPISGVVRAVASIGVTPWRTVLAGMFVIAGRWSKLGRIDSLNRMLDEIAQDNDPRQPILRRVREGDLLPGFAAFNQPDGDMRASALLKQMDEMLGKDADLARLKAAIDSAWEICHMGPNFALLNCYICRRIGMRAGDSVFPLARTVGWIAHSMEIYAIGEAPFNSPSRNSMSYVGHLPP